MKNAQWRASYAVATFILIKELLIKIHGIIGSLNVEAILDESKWDVKKSILKKLGILF